MPAGMAATALRPYSPCVTNEPAAAAKQIAQQLPGRLREHNLTLVSAGVAFYAFLAFVPALIVIVTVYGLVAKPADIQRQVRSFGKALPDQVQNFIQQQITSIGSANHTGVSITLLIAVAIALWSASGGMAALVTGINVARDQTQPKSFVKKRGKALALTFGAVGLLVVMMFLIAAVPSILTHAGLGTAGRVVFDILRWPLLAIVIVIGLGVLYHVAVEQPKQARFGVVTPGALVATLLWLIASGLFAVYTANFASYSKTYGSLASIVVVLLWLYLSAIAVLIGAEIDGISTTSPTGAT
jgi:membrane protein